MDLLFLEFLKTSSSSQHLIAITMSMFMKMKPMIKPIFMVLMLEKSVYAFWVMSTLIKSVILIIFLSKMLSCSRYRLLLMLYLRLLEIFRFDENIRAEVSSTISYVSLSMVTGSPIRS